MLGEGLANTFVPISASNGSRNGPAMGSATRSVSASLSRTPGQHHNGAFDFTRRGGVIVTCNDALLAERAEDLATAPHTHRVRGSWPRIPFNRGVVESDQRRIVSEPVVAPGAIHVVVHSGA